MPLLPWDPTSSRKEFCGFSGIPKPLSSCFFPSLPPPAFHRSPFPKDPIPSHASHPMHPIPPLSRDFPGFPIPLSHPFPLGGKLRQGQIPLSPGPNSRSNPIPGVIPEPKSRHLFPFSRSVLHQLPGAVLPAHLRHAAPDTGHAQVGPGNIPQFLTPFLRIPAPFPNSQPHS